MTEINSDTNVRVALRCRPINDREILLNDAGCVRFGNGNIIMTNPSIPSEEHAFAFDFIFDQSSNQLGVWEAVGVPTVEKAFSGFNGTIFACKLIMSVLFYDYV